MKIVVLDGYTLNPGDLSWKELEAIGDCTIYDRTPPELVIERASTASVILTNKVVLSRSVIENLPELKYIGVLATGYNVVDVAIAREREIIVTNIPVYGTASVAQMVFAHILNLTQHVAEQAETVRAGHWTTSPDFCYRNFPLIELQGLTLGIIGFGRIGQEVANIAKAFGMRVIGYSRNTIPNGMESVSLNDIFKESDILSLHCPLTPETEKLVNRERLSTMKPSAFLINTGRGSLLDESAVAEALNSGKIAGAGLDVLSKEPPDSDNPLLNARNCYITAHIAWATLSARKRLMDTAIENIRMFLDGTPQNNVS